MMKPVRDLYAHEIDQLNSWVREGTFNNLIIEEIKSVMDVDSMLKIRAEHTKVFMQGRYPNRPRDYFISPAIAGFHQYRLFEKTSKSYDFKTHAREFLNLIGMQKIAHLLLLEYLSLGNLTPESRDEEIKKFARLFLYAHVFMLWKGRAGENFFFDRATEMLQGSKYSNSFSLEKTTQEFDGKYSCDFVIRSKATQKISAGISIKSDGYRYNGAVKANGAHYEQKGAQMFKDSFAADIHTIIFDPVASNWNEEAYKQGLVDFMRLLGEI